MDSGYNLPLYYPPLVNYSYDFPNYWPNNIVNQYYEDNNREIVII